MAALAGDESSFETQLAGRVYSYRDTMAGADQTYADAAAQVAHDQTSSAAARDTWHGITDDNGSAATTYRAAYIQLDGQRRHDMAQAGLSFVTDLSSAAATAAGFIAAAPATTGAAAVRVRASDHPSRLARLTERPPRRGP